MGEERLSGEEKTLLFTYHMKWNSVLDPWHWLVAGGSQSVTNKADLV